ncbi:MAG: hypothetical protein JWR63_2867, partial [Conexibacter sp.]|nr:hypothetical protein [Conexibacter sp.]
LLGDTTELDALLAPPERIVPDPANDRRRAPERAAWRAFAARALDLTSPS